MSTSSYKCRVNELKIKQRYNLDDEQIYWRRWTIKNKCNNRLDKFTQENPSNDIEAFISTGKNVFDSEVIQDYKAQLKNPETQELINQRLAITESVGIVLKNGLNLLGIKALEKM